MREGEEWARYNNAAMEEGGRDGVRKPTSQDEHQLCDTKNHQTT
jgi:hypothetical protein